MDKVQEYDDFGDWWKATASPTDAGSSKRLSIGAITERNNKDHPGQRALTAQEALPLVRKLHPTPTLASRTIKRKEQMCVLDYTFKRARRVIPTVSPFSSSSVAASSQSFERVEDDGVVDEVGEMLAGLVLE